MIHHHSILLIIILKGRVEVVSVDWSLICLTRLVSLDAVHKAIESTILHHSQDCSEWIVASCSSECAHNCVHKSISGRSADLVFGPQVRLLGLALGSG